MNALTIGRLAKLTDTSRVTIRYYEKMGLLPFVARTASGYRHYPTQAVQRLHFIRNAKNLGFTLKEIKELLTLHDRNHHTSLPVVSAVESKITIVEQKIDHLITLKNKLKQLLSTCNGTSPIESCPIMENIFDNN